MLGGETAEMPGFYSAGEYELAGFIVGLADRSKLLESHLIRSGQILLGLSSTGLHTNGYSLARKLLFEVAGYGIDTKLPELKDSIGRTLLTPHRSYLSLLKPLVDQKLIKGLAHITGGGLTENLPRILPTGCSAYIKLGTWPVLPIFKVLQDLGQIEEDEMLRTFNMGIGMVVVVTPSKLSKVLAYFKRNKETVYNLGEIRQGSRKVIYSRR